MKRNNRKFVRSLTVTALIAALYTALTLFSALPGLSGGAIQLRLSEALCLLPLLIPEAAAGLAAGCALANLITGCTLWDIIFGTLATLIGCVLGRLLYIKLHAPIFVCTLPTLLSNMLIIPAVLVYTYAAEGSYLLFLLTVGIGEFISASLLGSILFGELRKVKFLK